MVHPGGVHLSMKLPGIGHFEVVTAVSSMYLRRRKESTKYQ